MKKIILLLAIYCVTVSSNAQNSFIDQDRPIASIDFSYSVNGNLACTILLNARQTDQSTQSTPGISFNAGVEGLINWETPSTGPEVKLSERLVSGTFLKVGAYKYIADLRTGTGAFVMAPTTRSWKNIENVKIKYEVNGKYQELPSLIIPPPSLELQTRAQLKVSNRAKMIDSRKGIITVESDPSGTPFEVVEVVLEKSTPAGPLVQTLRVAQLGENRYANNGQIDLRITSTTDLDLNGSYNVKVSARRIGAPGSVQSEKGSAY